MRASTALANREIKYSGHISLNGAERVALALGSALISLYNPRRADLVATLAETTSSPYFIYRLRDRMLQDPVGRQILRDRPLITSKSLDLDFLRRKPAHTLGYAYVSWLDREGVNADTRDRVRFIDDEECAYVLQRYRQCHDFYHALTGLPIFVEGEVALKAFEFANTILPMTGLSTLAAFRMRTKEKRRFWKTYLPWALENGLKSKDLMNVYWEKELDRDVNDLRAKLSMQSPPDLRQARQLRGSPRSAN